jgi:single-stranded-DNA-specific exonuclease
MLRRREAPVFAPWADATHPVLQRVYAARGVLHPQQAESRLARLLSPETLGGLEAATALLADALRTDQRLLVVGDFDCDGATGTAVAVRGLRLLGARHVGFRVPHRLRHATACRRNWSTTCSNSRPDLIVTVDSGIACVRGVDAANAANMRVLITDHHLPGVELPRAAAIVNPNLVGDGFPSKALAGVGVMFYLLLALRRRLREDGWFAQRGVTEPDLSCLLDLVALGTVADMVALDENNRVLVQAGLRRMRAGQLQPGLRALAQVSGAASGSPLDRRPRLCARPAPERGRPTRRHVAGHCLPARGFRARSTGGSRLNSTRSTPSVANCSNRCWTRPKSWLGTGLRSRAVNLPSAVCVFDPEWHPGVVGLVASRLKDRLHRPVIAFAPGGEDGLLRGSARSIAGFHIRDALADVAARNPGLMGRFGGHAMAAGLALEPANLDRFTREFATLATERIDAATLRAELWSDGELARSDITRDLAEQLRLPVLGPGFPGASFRRRVRGAGIARRRRNPPETATASPRRRRTVGRDRVRRLARRTTSVTAAPGLPARPRRLARPARGCSC